MKKTIISGLVAGAFALTLAGCGNSGTTNTMRVLGKKAGLITFFVDALKAVFCGLLVYALFYCFILDLVLF